MSDQDMLDLTMRDLAAKLALLAWYEQREPFIRAALDTPLISEAAHQTEQAEKWEKANPCPK